MLPLEPDVAERPETQLLPLARAPRPVGSPIKAVRPAAPPEDEPEERTAPGAGVAAFLRGLRRRWGRALLLGLASLALAGAAVWKLVPEKHTAQTLLRVESSQPTVLLTSPDGRSNFTNYQRTQAAMARSQLVLNAALRQPSVAELRCVRDQPNVLEWLEKNIKTDYTLAPEILRVSLSGDDPEEMKVLVNGITDAYLREVVDKEREKRAARLEQLKKLSAEYEETLGERRRNVRELAQSVGSRDSQTLALRQQIAQERLATAQRELAQVQADLRKSRLDAAAQEARGRVQEGVAVDAAVEEVLRKDPLTEKQRHEIADIEQKIEDTRRVALQGDDYPLVKKYRARIAAITKALEARRARLRPGIVEQLREKARNEVQVGKADIGGRIGLLKDMEKTLTADVQRLEGDTRKISKGTVDLQSFGEDLAQAEEMARRVAAQVEALKVELGAPSRVSKLEDASVSDGEGQKRKMLLVGGSGFGACLCCLLGLGLWEMRSRRIGTVDEVKNGLGLTVVGSLPHLPAHESGLSATAPETALQQQVLTESVDAMRTLLLNLARADGLRVLMITSADSGEGKTSLSAQLAASLARAGYRTLLVDADLRSPRLHVLFGLGVAPGLSEVLRVEAPLADAVQPTMLAGLSFLPAGAWDGLALRALARERGRGLFDALKARHDFVIVDSAPVLPVADSLLLAQHVDAVLFSLLRDVSRGPAVFAAQERIAMLGVRVLGAVVNGIRGEHSAPYRYSPPQADE